MIYRVAPDTIVATVLGNEQGEGETVRYVKEADLTAAQARIRELQGQLAEARADSKGPTIMHERDEARAENERLRVP